MSRRSLRAQESRRSLRVQVSRHRLRAHGLLVLFVASSALACAGGPGDPWHIPKGREGRFREANRICHQLTDLDDGITHRSKFDGCMIRRGWRRERWTDRFDLGMG